jgi:23S rRNA pseudouridine1911/1915/1917 synthase
MRLEQTDKKRDIRLHVLYEDNHLIGVFKPPHVLSQADFSKAEDMIALIKKYLIEKYQKPGKAFLGLIHRLDKSVSGVMLFAKTSKAASRLSEQIRQHKTEKIYLARVEGRVDSKRRRLESIVDSKQAVLEFERIGTDEKFSHLKVLLETGRKHQIRKQLSEIGHPICGDALYGSKTSFKEGIALVSYSFAFLHPISKESITITLPDHLNVLR